MPEANPSQCSLVRATLTTSPANLVVGRTLNTVGERTNAKKMIPPIQTISASSMRYLRSAIAAHCNRRQRSWLVVPGRGLTLVDLKGDILRRLGPGRGRRHRRAPEPGAAGPCLDRQFDPWRHADSLGRIDARNRKRSA